MVSVDLKHALGSLPVHGDLYDPPPGRWGLDHLEAVVGEDAQWPSGDVSMTVDQDSRNEYLRSLDDDDDAAAAGASHDGDAKKANRLYSEMIRFFFLWFFLEGTKLVFFRSKIARNSNKCKKIGKKGS